MGELDLSAVMRFEGVFAPLKDLNRFRELRVHPGLGTMVRSSKSILRIHESELPASGRRRRSSGASCGVLAKDDYLAIITAYVPDPEQWSADFRRQ